MKGSQQDFDQGFNAYENGFGSLTGSFWMGLSAINYLTSMNWNNNKTYSLQVDVTSCNGIHKTENYASFYVSLRIVDVPIVQR